VDKHSEDSGKICFSRAVEALKLGAPERAVELCEDYLSTHLESLPHQQLLGHALSKMNRFTDAEKVLRAAILVAPDLASLQDELGSLLAQTDRFEDAIECFKKALVLTPNVKTQRKLAGALSFSGQNLEAENVLRDILQQTPDNVDVLNFLAMTYQAQNKQVLDAEALLRKACSIAPQQAQAWQNLAALLIDQHRWLDAIDVLEQVCILRPQDASARANLGHARSRNGAIITGLADYETALSLNPDSAGVHMSRAHLLKTLGRQQDSLAAYRQAIAIKPDLGEAYWSMANLKVVKFSLNDIEKMQAQVDRPELPEATRVHFHFSLGKACEDQNDYDSAWQHYHKGNQLQRSLVDYDPVEHKVLLEKMKRIFTPEFIASKAGSGNPKAAPIFIVGLPRSGSTLIEQILASHSQVEGTEELHHISSIAHSTGKFRNDGALYPGTLNLLENRDYAAFAQQYLKQTQQYRVLGRSYFIDKMPNNFSHIGWIKLLFPNAKIINTRRFPLDSLLGAYKQLFAKGQAFTYDELELSEYYLDYTDIMEHWHKVFPGQILDVHYEHHMDDFDAQVRRILDYCGLDFEESCLHFYKTDRAVKTASSEQVRQPIYKNALGLWKHYAEHLSIWQEDLEPVIQALPKNVKELAG
jgi:tetratricopeptide (TPR) repeat protein